MPLNLPDRYKEIDKGLWVCARYLADCRLQIKHSKLTGPQRELLEWINGNYINVLKMNKNKE